MGRIKRSDIQDKLAFTEQVMGRTFNRRQWEKAICEQFDVGPRAARRYIRAVRRQWAIRANDKPDIVRAELLDKLEHLYERAISSDDLRSAERILWRIGEVRGVIGSAAEEAGRGPVQVLVLNGSGESPQDAMTEITERARELRALKAGTYDE